MEDYTEGHMRLEFSYLGQQPGHGIAGWPTESPLNYLEDSKKSRACLTCW